MLDAWQPGDATHWIFPPRGLCCRSVEGESLLVSPHSRGKGDTVVQNSGGRSAPPLFCKEAGSQELEIGRLGYCGGDGRGQKKAESRGSTLHFELPRAAPKGRASALHST
jgi:hypothetical protein